MNRVALVVVMLFALGSFAQASSAQDRVELIVDVEGVHRQNGGAVSGAGSAYQPEFENGGGFGLGVNWHFSGRVSLEVKAAVLASDMSLRVEEGDFVALVDVGYVNMVPVTALVQWHPFEKGSLRFYVGAGVAHVFIEDIEAEGLVPRTEFSNTTGLVVDAGLRIPMSKRWSFTGDARYIPVETSGTARFGPNGIEGNLDVRPLIVSFGLAYQF